VHPVQPDSRAQKETQGRSVQLDPQEILDRMDPKDSKVRLVCREFVAILARLVGLGRLVLLACKEAPALRGSKDNLGLLDLRAVLDPKVSLETQDQLDHRGRLVQQALRVILVSLDCRVHQVQSA